MLQLDKVREVLLRDRGRIRSGRALARRGVTMLAVKGLSMEKRLCYGSMGVSGFLLLLFLLDLVLAFPFGRINTFVDILGIIASALILYLAYDAFRDLR